MSGLLLIVVVGLWGYVALRIARWASHRIQREKLRKLTLISLFIGLLLMPVGDEIVGGIQFRSLCDQYAVEINMNKETIKGKTLYYDYIYPFKTVRGQVTSDELISQTWIPIWRRSVRYLEAGGNVVVSYNELYADGGWISRNINFNSTHAPYTFAGKCIPKENIRDLFKSLEVTVHDRPKQNIQEEMK